MAAGRPKIVEAPKRELLSLTDADIAAIAPIKDGQPDCYNYMPTRMIPLDEAQQRGWSTFYDGRVCRYGHQAPRYVSNVHKCVDCHRISRGKEAISGRSSLAVEQPRKYEKKAEMAVGTVKTVEPDNFEKRFLTEYAAVKDLDRAAKLVNSSAAQIHSRLSYSKVFRDATNDLEQRLNIRPTVPETSEYKWDEDKRARLLTVFIDSGDIATARDAIGVTASEWYKELARNPVFSAQYDEAYPLAMNSLEERAKQLALAGNDKLIGVVLKAEKPGKYTERVNMNLNVTEKLTSDQLLARIRQQLTVAAQLYRSPIIDAQFTEPQRAIGVSGELDSAESESQSQSNSDLL